MVVDVSAVQLARMSERALWSESYFMLCGLVDVYNVSRIYVPIAFLKDEYRWAMKMDMIPIAK